MEVSQKQRKAFLKKFGYNVSDLIYTKFKSKGEFLRETGFLKKSLHLVLTGGDTRLSTIYRLSKALGVKAKELLPDE